jgi:ribonuclease J
VFAPQAVMLVRPWMLPVLDKEQALAGAKVFWSQWEGYLRDGPGAAFQEACATKGLPFEVIHTSGHASVPDLRRLASAIAAKRVIPIHTFERDRYPALFDNVALLDDGQWMEV